MHVRKAVETDAKAVARVHVDSWKTTYKGIIPDEFLESLSYESREQIWERGIPNGNVFVVENEKGQIVGFSTGGKERSGKYEGFEGELYAIYLLEEFQGRGLGKMLVKPVVELLESMEINSMLVLVLEENKSCHFYEALGARKIDLLDDEIGGRKLKEAVYGWNDLKTLFE